MPWKVNFVITILIIIILAFIVILTLMDRNNWKDFVVIIILVEAAKTTLQSKNSEVMKYTTVSGLNRSQKVNVLTLIKFSSFEFFCLMICLR